MSEPKKHHFVPRVYLNNFKDNDAMVWCADLQRRKVRKSSPTNVAFERDINTVTLPNRKRDRTTVEAFFSRFEEKFPHVIKAGMDGSLDYSGQVALVHFAALQLMRAPVNRKILSELVKHLSGNGSNDDLLKGLSLHEHDLLDRLNAGDKQASIEVGLAVSGHFLKEVLPMLDRMNFSFVTLQGPQKIITSDNPVFLSGVGKGKSMKWRIHLNLPSVRQVLFYPLSPNSFLFGDTNGRNKDEVFRFLFVDLPDGSTLARAMNKITILNAENSIFSESKQAAAAALITRADMPTRQPQHSLEIGQNVGKLISAFYSQMKLA